jgi:hypothetical protein
MPGYREIADAALKGLGNKKPRLEASANKPPKEDLEG